MSDVGSYDITIKQGETWDLSLTLQEDDESPIDLTGYDVKMQIKKNYDDYVIEELSIANGKINNASFVDGIVGLRLENSDTKHYKFNDAKYDIKFISPSDEVSYVIEGTVTINRSVTL